MKYADFKKALDEYFLPDDEIFPHAQKVKNQQLSQGLLQVFLKSNVVS